MDSPFFPTQSAMTDSASSQAPSVLVFGGSGVIGNQICRKFGQEQWRVCLHYYTNRRLSEQTAQAIQENGTKVVLNRANIRNFQEVDGLIQSCTAQVGRLDVLVYAVGLGTNQLLVRTTPESWADLLTVNLTGCFYMLKSVGPIFEKQQEGAIIILGSLSSLRGSSGQGAYAASKAGLIGLIKTAAREWGGYNIRVNAIFPGWQASPLSGTAFPDSSEIDDHVLGRTSSSEEVAKAVYQLSQMKDVSGQVWNLDSRIW